MISPEMDQTGCIFTMQTIMAKRGFQLLGSGLFSAVYGREGWPYAIKVGNGRDSWADYVEWATAHGWAGGFAPRVYRLRRTSWGVMALMERLECTLGRVDETSPHYEAKESLYFHSERIEARYPGISCFFRQAHAAGFCGDWSLGNFMVKGPRLVLTDPSAAPGEDGRRRWRAIDLLSKPGHVQ